MDPKNICLACMYGKGENQICPVCGWDEKQEFPAGQNLAPGTILQNKYLIGRVLGQGGFGITYLAWDMDLNIKLAIKEYLPRDFATRGMGETEVSLYTGTASQFFEEGREKFLEEARTLARFEEHPNIVSVRDFFRENKTAYFVMSYIEGVTIKEYLKNAPDNKLDFSTTLAIMMPVMDALAEVHSAGILHRDISPDNIFITDKGVVKLLDFGAARQAVGEHSKSLSVVLKPGYAPEEQYRSKGNQGPWTDIYAVGATIYRMITGRVPIESLDRLAREELIPPSQLGVVLPEASEAALLKALAVLASDRYHNIKEFQQALITGQSSGVRPSAAPSPDYQTPTGFQVDKAKSPPAKPRPRLLLAAVAAILLSLVIGAVWWTLSPEKTTGSYVFADGRQYQGDLQNNIPHGHGIATVPSQGKYEGEWRGGKETGQHTFTYTNGNKYVGEMAEGQPGGQGTMTQANGTTYTGTWKDGKPDGKGLLKSANGSSYEGDWKMGVQDGQGKYVYPDGNTYTGDFKQGAMTGKGTINYNTGAVYTGEVKNGLLEGQGVYIWPNKDKYEGSFVNGKKEGRGKLTRANGQVQEGMWKNDVFVSP
ncbi:MAG: protein kinase [Syntrophomonas sp.]